MFTTLLESRATRTRRTGGTTVSALVHGAVIVLAISFTTSGNAAQIDEGPVEVPLTRILVEPPKPTETVPQTPVESHMPAAPQHVNVVIDVPNFTPTTIPPITAGPEIPLDRIVIGGPSHPGTAGGPAINTNGIVDVEYVERAPGVLGSPRPPRYPQMLRETGTLGNVVIRFVVDTLGRAEMGDINVVESTHALFTDAVKSALVDYRFTPGEVAGKKVRTLVQMPFVFSIR